MGQHEDLAQDGNPGAPSEGAAQEGRRRSPAPAPPPDGLRQFLLMWSGQEISLICLGVLFAAVTDLALAWPRMRLEDVIPDAVADAPAT